MTLQNSFQIKKKSQSIEIIFPSTFDNIDLTVDHSIKFLQNLEIPCDFFKINLILREGLSNAVRHGNLMNKQKTVKYSIKIDQDSIIIKIKDQGDGFIKKPNADKKPEKLLKDHGRGISIMEDFSSMIKYNKKGNKLTLYLPKK